MPQTALLLAFASAIIHALWNVMLKRTRDLDSASAGVFAVSMLLTAAAIPFIPGRAFAGTQAVLWGLAAGVCEGSYFVGLVRTLERAPLGWSYSWMRGSAIALLWPVSMLFMAEPFRWAALGCVTAVCTGLALLGSSSGPRSRGALSWALLTGVCIAGYILFYKLSLARGAHPLALYSLSMAVGLPIQTLVRIRRRGFAAFRVFPEEPGLVLVAGFLCALGFSLFLVALSRTGAAAVTTVRNSSVAFAVIFSLALGERPGARQWAGVALVTLGAMGLSWKG
ncbi:MAG: DMT family transporter [Geothrix sp.]|nr:DMT family transporter [Geothrix sp.]